jgi:sulfatase maturation enzyme AslB (radical SAM superfamily)
MSNTICVLPFIHLNLLPSGQATVCCVSTDRLYDEQGRELNVRTHTLDEMWRSSALKEVRTKMLDGEEPAQCSGCYEYERISGNSHRNGQNSLFLGVTSSDREWTRFPKIARSELAAEMRLPWYFDLRFDNLCNLKCVICFAYASSRIEGDEVHRSWTGEDAIPRTPNRFANTKKWVDHDRLFEELKEIGSEARYIQLAGGEPFLSSLALRWIEYLGQTGQAKNITLKVFTNLTTFNDKIVELLKPFAFIDMTLSIDGVGAMYEYVRYPGKWSAIEQNAVLLAAAKKDVLPQMSININATMSAHGASRILDVFEFASQHDFGVTLGNAMSPPHSATKYLPNGIKRDLIERLTAFASKSGDAFPHLVRHVEQWSQDLLSVDISDEEHHEAVRNLMRFTNDMDLSRNLSFRSVAPDVVKAYENEFGAWLAETKFVADPEINGTVVSESISIGGVDYRLADRLGGSVESVIERSNGFAITGWAADHQSNKSATSILASIGGEIVARSVPTQRRPDIEEGLGNGIRPAGFSLWVRKQGNRPTTDQPIAVYATTSDNYAVRLAAPAGFSCVEPFEFKQPG